MAEGNAKLLPTKKQKIIPFYAFQWNWITKLEDDEKENLKPNRNALNRKISQTSFPQQKKNLDRVSLFLSRGIEIQAIIYVQVAFYWCCGQANIGYVVIFSFSSLVVEFVFPAGIIYK